MIVLAWNRFGYDYIDSEQTQPLTQRERYFFWLAFPIVGGKGAELGRRLGAAGMMVVIDRAESKCCEIIQASLLNRRLGWRPRSTDAAGMVKS